MLQRREQSTGVAARGEQHLLGLDGRARRAQALHRPGEVAGQDRRCFVDRAAESDDLAGERAGIVERMEVEGVVVRERGVIFRRAQQFARFLAREIAQLATEALRLSVALCLKRGAPVIA